MENGRGKEDKCVEFADFLPVLLIFLKKVGGVVLFGPYVVFFLVNAWSYFFVTLLSFFFHYFATVLYVTCGSLC